MERDPVFRFLGTHIDKDLSCATNATSAVKSTAVTPLSQIPQEKLPVGNVAPVLLPLLCREVGVLSLCGLAAA